MGSSVVKRLLLLAVMLALPGLAAAQEATIAGTISDTTGGVLPGVTIRAVNDATGNSFEAVTDERGGFRIPVRIGNYKVTVELSGFTTVNRTAELLVGQTAVLNVQMSPSTLQETVTVTGEAPLLDTTSSTVGGNIDPRQVQELPVQGGSWTALALLAPGNRTNSQGAVPITDRNNGESREFQLNMDGQQVSAVLGTGGQPMFSRAEVAEFQFISNRFDATQGRSSGVQVNAVSKSGTNNLSGLFQTQFRDDSFNSKDFFQDRVLPYSNQQYTFALGGPIMRDRLHFFANYEYEREPRESVWNTSYPGFNVALDGKASRKVGGARFDYQVSPKTRVMFKAHGGQAFTPFGTPGATHPASTNDTKESSNEYLGQLTTVLGNSAVNEIKVGRAEFTLANKGLASWSNHWQKANGITTGAPRIRFTGFNITPNSNHPRERTQDVWSFRDDFTFSYNLGGRHDVKSGFEYLRYHELTVNCRLCAGEIDARGGARPANLDTLFADPFNVDTWNLNAIAPIVRSYTLGLGDFPIDFNQPKYGLWWQDDWQIASRFTLNLGVRWDLTQDAFANDFTLPPIMAADRKDDTNNIQPRVGFAWQVNDRTVIRGGSGLYYGDALSTNTMWAIGNTQIATIVVNNDGRADFVTNPFNGPAPTYAQAVARFCHNNNIAPGCLRFAPSEVAPPGEYARQPRSFQNSIGMQRQFGNDMSLEADYVYNHGTDEKLVIQNVNLTYNPATGANYPFSDISRRPFPAFGEISMWLSGGKSSYHALQMVFTKRFSNRWQASGNYTLSALYNEDPLPLSGLSEVTIPLQPDFGGEWTLAADDQRHRAVFNGIYQIGHGLQFSGLYFFGSGQRFETSYGADLRQQSRSFNVPRLRPDGTLVPRNDFVGEPIHRIDIRLQQRIPLGRVSIDGIFEVFNLFNRENYGSYTTDEASSQYGDPSPNNSLSYTPRAAQLGFRVAF
ncbi:MAG: TonB-dependent receptor [Vicinamibacterales bacterium]